MSRENPWVPRKVFLTKGVGIHAERLNSFEEALRDARISPMNLVKVSSIVPPHCELIDPGGGLKASYSRPDHLLRHVQV